MRRATRAGALIGLAALLCAACAERGPELRERKEKESYGLGYQFGRNMKYQGGELDLDLYMEGLRDALEGRKAQMTMEDIRKTIAAFQQRLAAAQQKSLDDQAEKNLAEGRAFLEENAKKEGVRVLPSGLQYRVVKEGGGKTSGGGGSVTVHYRGTLVDGTEFESSFGRAVPPTFELDGLIPGWTEALKMMKEGDRWQIVLPPGLAYGEKGRPPTIPPNSTLVFEIELISVQ